MSNETTSYRNGDIVIYRNREYRVLLTVGKRLQIYPVNTTPRDRERGPLTVGAAQVSAK